MLYFTPPPAAPPSQAPSPSTAPKDFDSTSCLLTNYISITRSSLRSFQQYMHGGAGIHTTGKHQRW
ncbi:hypothetical protein A2U01_0062298 [Trifolium medium]|uniref:Uncharacterized protein n=1 Tax=Trifolium medium TaxID=97028 RepID=A0A392RZL2_9FABA|nr:hypothetical protein [Trifolium medium]